MQLRVIDFSDFFSDNRSGMFSGNIMNLIYYVITSWQVIAVTVAIVLYIFLINYVTRPYRRPRFVSKSKPQKAKAVKREEKPEINNTDEDPETEED